jgi:hypothetical protein
MAEFIHTDGIAEFGVIHHLVESIQFMCDFCQRGVRPPLDLLILLLSEYDDVQVSSLRDLPVRISKEIQSCLL